MHEIFNMLLAVFDRAALMLICLFFLIRIRLFRELLHKSAHSPRELLAVTAIFSMFALFSTWSGVPVEGSLVNVRIIAVMSGGILFGPWVGIITGVIAGLHRYLIDIGGVTAVPCLITSIIAGILSGWINRKIPKKQHWRAGIIAGDDLRNPDYDPGGGLGPHCRPGAGYRVENRHSDDPRQRLCGLYCAAGAECGGRKKRPAPPARPSWRWILPIKTLPLFRDINAESLRKSLRHHPHRHSRRCRRHYQY
ncbi:Inner membrane protein ypdA [Leclercia adecarboxylata]|uniref:Inner membrane protein ypdA n=1 Tax=Leclercia adecarboxylata TaxID=83655 RepID=A0A4U9I9R7_9ENTR|nr:Inner membrane protein ypdA [Leclercia adecarboxylata]